MNELKQHFMGSHKSIVLVLSLIILLLPGLGIVSLTYLKNIAAETRNLYLHPYTVSNAARDINIELVSMYLHMDNIAASQNNDEIKSATRMIDQHELKILNNFNLIFERYLGDPQDIQTAYEAFINWKAIRDEVIFLKTRGLNQAALDVSRSKGAKHLLLLNRETRKLIDFADNKARNFLNNSVAGEEKAMTIISFLLGVTVLVSILISYYAVHRLNMARIDTRSRLHLIDQNIMMARLDPEGIVLDVSNSLCRYLDASKNDLVGKPVSWFDCHHVTKNMKELILKIVSTGKTWEGELCRLDSNGTHRWMNCSVHPDLDENYQIRGYININQDITDKKALAELSVTDTLTKLHNRRHFEEIIEREIKIAARNNAFLTLAIVDIDFFKRYNDIYGHPAGDHALINVARVLKSCCQRPRDYIFRLGGEEFGILFPELPPESVPSFLENIRKKVEELQIDHQGNEVATMITISIGAYTCSGSEQFDHTQLYLKADRALYRAKKRRNSIITGNMEEDHTM